MLKPLELTAYPLDTNFPRGYKLPRDTRITVRSADRMAVEKRLTESELAAEYWRAVGDESMITEGYNWTEMCGEWPISEEEAIRRSRILTRFATLPHYDEKETP